MTTLSLTRRQPLDFVFAVLMLLAAGFAFSRYGAHMDYYEQAILAGVTAGLIWFGWFWPAMRYFLPAAGVLALIGTALMAMIWAGHSTLLA